jgi:hypothetical protein
LLYAALRALLCCRKRPAAAEPSFVSFLTHLLMTGACPAAAEPDLLLLFLLLMVLLPQVTQS